MFGTCISGGFYCCDKTKHLFQTAINETSQGDLKFHSVRGKSKQKPRGRLKQRL